MDFFEIVSKRYSHRGAFTSAPVPKEDVLKIVTAAMQAPSGCNAQTTFFTVVTDPKLIAALGEIITADAVRTAPVVVVVSTVKETFNFGLDFELEDYGAAVENILLGATALGYASCWFDGTSRLNGNDEKIRALLGVPVGQQVRTLLPIGVPQQVGAQAPRKALEDRVRFL